MAFWEGISFTQSQKKGLWLTFWLIGLLCLLLWLKQFFPPEAPDLSYLPQLEDNQEAAGEGSESKPYAGRKTPARVEINTADSAAWAALPGIGPVLSRRIIRYRQAKGGFSTLDEIQQVYGLRPETWQSIRPFLYLDPASLPSANSPVPERAPISPIDINLADSLAWEQLPGIGKVLSARIVRYRDLIGGFQNKTDLQKVYGLSEETYVQIEPFLLLDTTQLKLSANQQSPSFPPSRQEELPIPPPTVARREIPKVELNQADSAQLVSLPGIGKTLAPRILSFRDNLGYFVEVEQLKSVYGLSEENYQRFAPHLTVTPPSQPAKQDLNVASSRQLVYLSGIDQAWAEAFLAYRRKLGRFTRWEEVEAFPQATAQTNRMLRAYFTLTNP